ncbi:MAG: endonuclease/exonuclease/phosphatase family protein, partial [Gloeobacteraceae cyanobacterium ES-bin-144]|nr:endonuclease/exonuclease/phosphatase family protein [Verrucomicrobiales bacterium]
RFEADLADSGTLWLSDTPELAGSKTWGNGIPRVASWLRLVDRASQRGFYVFNTHWDHRDQNSREHAALLLARKIDARKFPDQPVVMLGDFNAVENNPAVAYLVGKRVSLAGQEGIWKHGLLETFQILHANDTGRTTLHFWSGTRNGVRKVDHILVSEGAKVIDANIRDGDSPMISDHFPVTSHVVFP